MDAPNSQPCFPIYIPSKGRYNSAPTCAGLDAAGIPYTIITTAEEQPLYEHTYRGTVLPLQREGMHIGAIRNIILKEAQGWIWMIDDDITGLFHGHASLRKPCSWSALTALETAIEKLPIALAGLCHRPTMQTALRIPYKLNTDCYHLLAINVAAIGEVRYNEDLFFFSDTDFLIRLLQQGKQNARFLSYSYTCQDMGNTPGGLYDTYKTANRRQDALSLQKTYGADVITILPSDPKRPDWTTISTNWRRAATMRPARDAERTCIKQIGSFPFLLRPDTNDEAVIRSDIIDHQYSRRCTYLPDDCWLDIGGHIGATAIEMAGHVKRVHSYEPYPGNFHLLCQNVQLNQCENIDTYPYAIIGGIEQERQLAIHQGTGTFEQYTGCHSFYAKGRRYRSMSVSCLPIGRVLDETGARNLKIDTEGEEYAIMMAFPDWNAIDEIIFEWHPKLVDDPTFQKYHQILSLLEQHFEVLRVDPTPFGIGQVIVHAVKQSKLDRKEER